MKAYPPLSIFWFCIFAFIGFTMVQGRAGNVGDEQVSATNKTPGQATSELEILLNQSDLATRAYVKDKEIQLSCTKDAQSFLYEAEWKESRAPAEGFSYSTANLTLHKATRAMPNPSSRWREVKVLNRTESERLLTAAANQLVPSEPGHGIHSRHAFGDGVLFRDATGRIEFRSVENKPPGLVIDKRYSRQELASATATAIEHDLQTAYPGQMAFILEIEKGSRFRLAFVDLLKKRVVILYLPREGERAHLGFRLANWTSVILVDHVWTFLKNPFSSIGRTLNQWTQWPITMFPPRLRAKRGEIPPLKDGPGMDLSGWEQWLDRHTNTRLEKGTMRLLVDGDHFFPLIERRIAEAQSNINIHVCIFDRDDLAVGFADHLKQRSTNIEVKVVFDRINTRSASRVAPVTMQEGFVAPKSIASYLRSGSKVAVRPQPNPGLTADHSKVYLIDRRYAYVGGMNLGREYRYEWHDLMAEIEGPIVASFQREFDKKWAQVGLWGDCGLASESLAPKKSNPGPLESPGEMMELRRLYTKTFERQIREAECEAVNRASNYVYAENPYFYSNELLVRLARARLRGVDVRVILPSENDTGAGHKSNMVVANYLLAHGVRVYFYPGMTHVKAILVDGWACFGSANFDALSLRLLREADLATSNPAFVSGFKREVFQQDFARCRELKESLSTDWSDYLADTLLAPF